jgi:dethiobiotin synthetase
MAKGLFVTGTDTDVGKTIITASIAASLRKNRINVGVFKPMMSGAKRDDPHSDAFLLKEMSGDPHTLEEINPFQFDEPLAPYVAAKRENRSISLEKIKQAWIKRQAEHEFFLIEGAGGLMVPMGPSYLVADIAKEIGFPLLIVARAGLGTVNHTLLTIDVARRKGLMVAGVILNGLKEESKGVAEETNPSLIEEFSGVPVLGTVPWMETLDRETMIRTIEEVVSKSQLFDLFEYPRSNV